MTIYLSGPMTGIKDFNYPAFNAAATELRARGHTVLNPAESFAGEPYHPREWYMRKDIEMLLRADGVALLPGWFNSRGSRLECTIAREIGIPYQDVATLLGATPAE
jgi:hypothetical protein